ncbi:hypothetical protein KCP73_01930 [Salmonella enterica subsp. enterica]|nr:hypothetical protein KCP73_01930 [Salmonella enterica subsp. enterica]
MRVFWRGGKVSSFTQIVEGGAAHLRRLSGLYEQHNQCDGERKGFAVTTICNAEGDNHTLKVECIHGRTLPAGEIMQDNSVYIISVQSVACAYLPMAVSVQNI